MLSSSCRRSWHKDVEPIVRHAGDILLSYRAKELVCEKKPDGTFVTEADQNTEQYLIQSLKKVDSSISFFAEESGETGNTKDLCWVIDPLDGTANFPAAT